MESGIYKAGCTLKGIHTKWDTYTKRDIYTEWKMGYARNGKGDTDGMGYTQSGIYTWNGKGYTRSEK